VCNSLGFFDAVNESVTDGQSGGKNMIPSSFSSHLTHLFYFCVWPKNDINRSTPADLSPWRYFFVLSGRLFSYFICDLVAAAFSF
jgi:hypothetical protein